MRNDIGAIARALARGRDPREVYEFLVGIMTPQELRRIALRWRLVKLLLRGMPQREIARELGISLCKITRGSRELRRGPDGFRRIVARAARREMKGGTRARNH